MGGRSERLPTLGLWRPSEVYHSHCVEHRPLKSLFASAFSLSAAALSSSLGSRGTSSAASSCCVAADSLLESMMLEDFDDCEAIETKCWTEVQQRQCQARCQSSGVRLAAGLSNSQEEQCHASHNNIAADFCSYRFSGAARHWSSFHRAVVRALRPRSPARARSASARTTASSCAHIVSSREAL